MLPNHKSKKWTLAASVALLATIVSSTANAEGFGAGNSGTVVICTDPSTGTERLNLLDIWEYTEAPGRALNLNIPETGISIWWMQTEIDNAVEKLLTAYADDSHSSGYAQGRQFRRSVITDEIAYVKHMLFTQPFDVGSGRSIQYPAELLPPVRDPNCTYHSLVSYQRDGRIITDQTLIHQLVLNRGTQFVALILHEALYRIARDFQDVQDSYEVRELVAQLLARDSNADRISYLSRTLLTPSNSFGPTQGESGRIRFRIPHTIEGNQFSMNIYLKSRARLGRNDCQVSASLQSTNGVPLQTLLVFSDSFLMRSGDSRTVSIESSSPITYRDLKVNRYQLKVEMDCTHPNRIITRNLSPTIETRISATANAGYGAGYNPLQQQDFAPLANQTTMVEFR